MEALQHIMKKRKEVFLIRIRLKKEILRFVITQDIIKFIKAIII